MTTQVEKKELQKLLQMDEKEFFAESMMFMLGKVMGLTDGSVSPNEFKQSKAVVDGMSEVRELFTKMQEPLPTYPNKGWLFPYLIEGDRVFNLNRWAWWTDCQIVEEVQGSIPQIEFHTYQSSPGVKETLSHIEEVLRGIEFQHGSSSLMVLVQWLLYGFGSHNIKEKRWSEEVDRFLYEKFQLGRLQQNPFDFFAVLAQETKGKGRWSNPTAFFQTPPNLCQMMVQMALGNDEDTTTKSICDPCAGTGTLLLFASNHSVNLYAQEICLDLVLMLEANAYLYVPWLVRPAKWLKNSLNDRGKISKDEPSLGEASKGDQSSKTEGKRLVIEHKEIVFKNDPDGQLLLFE